MGNFTEPGFVPDGTDFYLDSNNVRHIRWYGLPRDSNGDGVIDTVTSASSGGVQDVLPLAYFLGTSAAPAPVAGLEQIVLPNRYICAWDATPKGASPTVPKIARPTMFRITIEVIDATGRLTSPRVFQYILPVSQQ